MALHVEPSARDKRTLELIGTATCVLQRDEELYKVRGEDGEQTGEEISWGGGGIRGRRWRGSACFDLLAYGLDLVLHCIDAKHGVCAKKKEHNLM
jgi:hypothetical protein